MFLHDDRQPINPIIPSQTMNVSDLRITKLCMCERGNVFDGSQSVREQLIDGIGNTGVGSKSESSKYFSWIAICRSCTIELRIYYFVHPIAQFQANI